MAFYFLLATTNFILQFIVLVLLIASILLKRKNKFWQHGLTMLSAVILHTIMILSIMIPSIIGIYFAIDLSITISGFALVHAIIGTLTWILGLWIVVSWCLRKDLKYCISKKHVMLATYFLWLLSIALGTILYLNLYLPVT